ncbi:LytR family transcriptional regulator [Saccharothrix syringae]|uniref:LytR family transcriptional regulator n=2 Tax=Saccharothrix syringae TaxID=103733 RepID=A0A5Q0HDP1_SACSY|nr:LytR family transcriptional regulator [Saccharothrix syringae]
MSAAVLVAAGVAWSAYQEVDTGVRRSQAIPPDAPRSTSGTNVLVMGLTTRRNADGTTPPQEVLDALHAGDVDRGGYNANTLVLLHLGAGPAVALSIPRDNEVALLGIPGGGPRRGKVKEAYGRAKEALERTLPATVPAAEAEWLGREAGRRAQVLTVQALLGVPVDHLVEVSMVGFHHLTTALGGIDVCLNRATRDPSYSGADFPAGVQHLTPAQTLAFVRQRHGLPRGDLDRVRRQQAFLGALARRVGQEGPASLAALVEVAEHHVVVSEGWDALAALRDVSGATFHTLPLDGEQALREAAAAVLDPRGSSGPPAAPSPVPCVD